MPRWDDDDDVPQRQWPTPPRGWWKPVAWLAAWLWLFVLAGVLANLFGAFVGYLVVLVAVVFAAWRVDRWCARQYWGGLREWHG